MMYYSITINQRFIMRAKSERRLEAERLRLGEGLSYNEISAKMDISKSTLSYWLRDLALTPEQQDRLEMRLQDNRQGFAARAWPINRERHASARRAAYQDGLDVVSSLPEDRSVHELAFAMLYLGEGTKAGNRVLLGSTSPDILRYTLWALRGLYGVDESEMTCRLHLIVAAEHLEPVLRAWWAHQLGISLDRFQPTTYDRRPRDTTLTDDYHGVCEVLRLDTYLQQRILGVAYGYLASLSGEKTQEKPVGQDATDGPVMGGTGLEPVDLGDVNAAL